MIEVTVTDNNTPAIIESDSDSDSGKLVEAVATVTAIIMLQADMTELAEIDQDLESSLRITLRSLGFSGMPMLISAISLERWVPPILHLKLGLEFLTLNIVVKFIRDEVETETNAILEGREVLRASEENYHNLFEETEGTMPELGSLLTALKAQQ
jgi:hypothetical protein